MYKELVISIIIVTSIFVLDYITQKYTDNVINEAIQDLNTIKIALKERKEEEEGLNEEENEEETSEIEKNNETEEQNEIEEQNETEETNEGEEENETEETNDEEENEIEETNDEEKNETEETNEGKEEIEKLDEDEKILKQASENYEKWLKYHKRLAFYIEHNELEKVETNYVAGKSFIENAKYEDAISEIEKTIFVLKHINDKYSVNLENIF